MASPTPNKGYTYPAHGGDLNSWDAPLNTNFDTIDKNFGGVLTQALSTGTTILSASDAGNAIYIFTGALTGNCVVQWPAVGSTYIVENQTTGAFTVTLQCAGLGDEVVIPQGAKLEVYSDGTNMKTAVNAADDDFDVPGDLTVAGTATANEVDAVTVDSDNPYKIGGVALVLGHGQAIFQYTSATVCTLLPKNGDTIAFPAGGVLQIPSGGITLSNGGLSNSTLYYVYVLVGGTLEASTTSHTTDTNTGIEIKSGDATRVLVGMVYLVGGSFIESTQNSLVASWFNRKPKGLKVQMGSSKTSTSIIPTYTELDTNCRCQFLSWGDGVSATLSGCTQNSNQANDNYTCIGIDGVGSSQRFCESSVFIPNGGTNVNPAVSGISTTTEGYHYTAVGGAVGVGTGTWANGIATTLGTLIVN